MTFSKDVEPKIEIERNGAVCPQGLLLSYKKATNLSKKTIKPNFESFI
jgi:hypothetical protein